MSPQSNTQLLAVLAYLKCIKNGTEFSIVPDSKCTLVNGVIEAQLTADKAELVFNIEDLTADAVYPIKVKTLNGPTGNGDWNMLNGFHRSPGIRPLHGQRHTISLEFEFTICNPTGTCDGNTHAAKIKVPANVLVDPRLGE